MKYHGVTIPSGLSPVGERAARAIVDVLLSDGVSTRDLVFRQPQEWTGEYGHGSELVVIYEGCMAQPYFEYNYCQYPLIERMHFALADAGLFTEACTSYYSAVYRRDME